MGRLHSNEIEWNVNGGKRLKFSFFCLSWKRIWIFPPKLLPRGLFLSSRLSLQVEKRVNRLTLRRHLIIPDQLVDPISNWSSSNFKLQRLEATVPWLWPQEQITDLKIWMNQDLILRELSWHFFSLKLSHNFGNFYDSGILTLSL